MFLDAAKKQRFDDIMKYLEHQKSEHILKTALSDGGGELSQTNVILHGPPGAGKTSVKQLVIGLDPLPVEKQTATDIVENAVRAVSTSQVRQFKVVKTDEIIDMLADEVECHTTNTISTNSSDYRQESEGMFTKLFSFVVKSAPNPVKSFDPNGETFDEVKPIETIRERLGRATGPVKIYDVS